MTDINPYFVGCLAGLVLFVAGLVIPGSSGAPPMIKVGVVSWEQVVANYEEFQTDIEELEDRQNRLRKLVEEGQDGTTEAERRQVYDEALQQVQSRREKLVREAHENIYEAIEEVAIANGFSLVLSESEVLYASEAYTDLTRPVVKQLNQ